MFGYNMQTYRQPTGVIPQSERIFGMVIASGLALTGIR